jgi:glycosyltransferase involved in cell wall biosynthesis
MQVAIAKPDFGIRGGFEVVMDHVADELEGLGHHVSWLTVDASIRQAEVQGLPIPDPVFSQAPEYFRYLAIIEQFSRLDARSFDLVLCTQPGSWAVRHDRKVALFYHHRRLFYDLADLYAASGFVDPTLHELCTTELRAAEAPILDEVGHFLVPSTEVAARLERFNGVAASRQSPFHAVGHVPHEGVEVDPDPAGPVLCVSRHEWPKRTELAVSAAHQLEEPAPVVMVGSGGRLDHVHAVDRLLAQADAGPVDDEALWRTATTLPKPADGRLSPRVQLLGRVSDPQLEALYRRALCVVTPALLEDYGLTAIEAMAHGRPVIACHDGGGLLDTVRDGENGLVVEPTGRAIADAVERLRAEPALRKQLAAGALDTAAEYTWTRAAAQLQAALDAAVA